MATKNLFFSLLSILVGFCFTVLIYNFDVVLIYLEKLYENQILIHTSVLFFYFFLYLFLSRKISYKKWVIAIITVMTPLLIDASVLITNHNKIPIRFPFASIFPMLGIFLAYKYLYESKMRFYTFLTLCVVFLIFTYSYLMPHLFYYSMKKNNKKIENTIFKKKFNTTNNTQIILSDTCKAKCLIIESFFNGCLPCEQKSLILSKIRNDFAEPELDIIYICDGTITPVDKFIEYAKKKQQKGITFLYDRDSILQKDYKIHGYPFEIFGKCGIVYSTFEGFDESIKEQYYKETSTKIKQILNEH